MPHELIDVTTMNFAHFTYIVNLSEFQFVLIFIIKSCAVLIDEAHYWCFPPR